MLSVHSLSQTVKKNSRKSITLSPFRNLLQRHYCLFHVLGVILHNSKVNSKPIPGKSYEKIKEECDPSVWDLRHIRKPETELGPDSAANSQRTLETLCRRSLLLSSKWRCQYQSTFLAQKKYSLGQINFCCIKSS